MRVLITGAGGFIGSHLAQKLRKQGHDVFGVDIKYPEFMNNDLIEETFLDFMLLDLRHMTNILEAYTVANPDWVFHLAADMGGIGYITGPEIEIYTNNTTINLNIIAAQSYYPNSRLLFASSACVYPEFLQGDNAKNLSENMALPAQPDTLYGWDKLMMEQLMRQAAIDGLFEARIARLHNIFGSHGTWDGGKEKAPAALCRKVAKAKLSGKDEIELWGNGQQVRSFLHVFDCVNFLVALMQSDYSQPVNIGSDKGITIIGLAHLIASVAKVKINVKTDETKPVGVKWRISDNTIANILFPHLGRMSLKQGLGETYPWIEEQVKGQVDD